jgi:hypothetical protein
VTTTEVASFPSLDAEFGLRKRADVMETPLAFWIEGSRVSKRASCVGGSEARGTEWIANCPSLGGSLKVPQGDSPTGNDWLSLEARASKYGE